MKLRTLAENIVVIVGLFFFGILGGLLLQMLVEPSLPTSFFPISEWTGQAGQVEQAVADARIRTVIFGVVGGFVMGIVAGIAVKEEEE